MLWKCCTQYASKFGKLSSGHRPQDWKRSVFIPIPKKGNAKEGSNYRTIALISHASKVMLKILQARLQQYVSNFQMFKLALEKAEEPEVKLPSSVGSYKNQGNSRKTSISASLSMLKPLCGSQQTGKFWKRWEYQTTLSASWETCQVRKQQLEPDMEQQTGSKLGKEYVKTIYCHSAYLTYMQSTSCEMLGWMNHKLESRSLGEISTNSDMQLMWPPLWLKEKRN